SRARSFRREEARSRRWDRDGRGACRLRRPRSSSGRGGSSAHHHPTGPNRARLPGVISRAILRRPGPDFAQGITTASLGAPDYALLVVQHAAYADALRSVGLAVEVLDALPGFPDAY